MSKESPKTKGPWMHRLAIRFFTVVLALLVFWLLGFVVGDIRSVKGPQMAEIEKEYLDQSVLDRIEVLEEELATLERQITGQRSKLEILGDSTSSLQNTIDQLLELQNKNLARNIQLSEEEQATFTGSLNLFLENQRQYQEINSGIAHQLENKVALEDELNTANAAIEDQRIPAQKELNALKRRHDLKLAFFQLLFLLPLMIAAAVLFVRLRGSMYNPIFLAVGVASLIKVALVLHQYFPSRYFKYVLIVALLLAVLRILSHFIKSVAAPGARWVVKQYREAYQRFLCPVCEYPIRRGPMKYLFWDRRTVRKRSASENGAGTDEPYTCPVCGTGLYETCRSCSKTRSSLLPFCEHCGEEKNLAGEGHSR